jgi:hypothetical protein
VKLGARVKGGASLLGTLPVAKAVEPVAEKSAS